LVAATPSSIKLRSRAVHRRRASGRASARRRLTTSASYGCHGRLFGILFAASLHREQRGGKTLKARRL
jgi:hypothetical protein